MRLDLAEERRLREERRKLRRKLRCRTAARRDDSGAFVCTRCFRRFGRGRSKSAHMSHCGGVRGPTIGKARIRSDLLRVAQLAGRPEGVAPSISDYRRLGSFSPVAVQGCVRGYSLRDHRPRADWVEAVEALGFVSARRHRYGDDGSKARRRVA